MKKKTRKIRSIKVITPKAKSSKAKRQKSSPPKKFPDKELTKLAKRIKELRIKKGYSNYEFFAYDNNIPRAQYGRYEKGEDLRYTSLLRVVKALGVTMEDFFGEGF